MAKVKWIPVSRKLPPVGEGVLTTDKNGIVGEQVLEESVITTGKLFWTDPMGEYEYGFDTVLVWAPMPKPWEGR